jgi:putative transposase
LQPIQSNDGEFIQGRARRLTEAHAGKTQRRIVSAWIGTALAHDDADAASKQWRSVADQLRPRVPKLAALMDDAEADVLAFTTLPRARALDLGMTASFMPAAEMSLGS